MDKQLAVRPLWWIACGLVCAAAVSAGNETEIAGRTLQACSEQLQSEDRVTRLRAARSLAPFGASAADILEQALDHEDAAVRFIAAQQLGRIGGDALESCVGRLCELADDESSRAVQLAASYALCRHGLDDMHLPRLIESLEYPERGMACTAAFLIGEIGADADAAVTSLERAKEQNRPGGSGDYHLGGAAASALQKIRGR